MRRRGDKSPLFADDLEVEYLVDTSSWISLNDGVDKGEMWPIVQALIVAGRLFSPMIVIGETRSAHDLIKPYVDQLATCDRNDADYLLRVGVIARKYRRMCKPDGSRTKADPFLVALAILDGYTIVAEESLKRSGSKIPGVCRLEKVQCVTMRQLCANERFKIKSVSGEQIEAAARNERGIRSLRSVP
jgi:hypothetical protein